MILGRNLEGKLSSICEGRENWLTRVASMIGQYSSSVRAANSHRIGVRFGDFAWNCDLHLDNDALNAETKSGAKGVEVFVNEPGIG